MVQVDSASKVYNVQATSASKNIRVATSSKSLSNAVETSNNQAKYWADLAEEYANLAQQSSENAENSALTVTEKIQAQENTSIQNVQDVTANAIEELESKCEELQESLATTYVYEQAEANDTWVINHNLSKTPSVTIVDSADNVVEGEVRYIDENTIEIYFNGGFKGKAYLN
jgi:gas vesicle protein